VCSSDLGFDRKGNPIANDPAARADQGERVRIVYDRGQLEKAWQGRPSGTVYIIFPPGYAGPNRQTGAPAALLAELIGVR